ncbi:hypothetical protein [Cryptosporangium arvum]|uniref:Uncharacterized protein n=1 Tax=Cryptosporangium arvum DSM 44712 TaxID=927661 RepID=A0A011AIQ2_9ACTN|nr:hypothetical protein [Cryptosporangium arvum]EXG81896.1 hypothetical protein CryarDRAFT_3017 [Cryptosporangium arvum DSM 44712]
MKPLARAAYVVGVGAALLVAALFLPRSRTVDAITGTDASRPNTAEALLLLAAVLVAGVLAVVGLTRSRPWFVAAAGIPGFLTSLAWLWYVVDLRSGNRDLSSCAHEYFCTALLRVRPDVGAYLIVVAGLVITLGGAIAVVIARRPAPKPTGTKPTGAKPTGAPD